MIAVAAALRELLTAVGAPPAGAPLWRPRLFDLTAAEEQEALGALLAAGAVAFCHDTIAQQLAGLMETRAPTHKLSAADLATAARRHRGAVEEHLYGVWVYYPWLRELVHVLPEAEFRELRTSRNRNKITGEEQARLRRLTLGVAGLSVGRATAVTLALEEIGATYRLADFDHLELSNLNRLRAPLAELGVNKAILTAREIFRINPFAQVEIFPDGITETNLDGFLAGPPPLDILFEECDDLQIKIRLREHARAHGIAVLMETSDRGLIDVERFDLDPERPILHGLIGDLKADDLRGLSTYEKVPVVLKIIGAERISTRMAASLVDVETTLKTWPQLASGVALGGALNADAARRVALGHFSSSGRYYVDVESLVSDAADGGVAATPSYDIEIVAEAAQAAEVGGTRDALETLGGRVQALVRYAAMAPSGGNCQPWRFVWRGNALECHHDHERSASLLDFDDSASHLALGAAVENMVQVAPELGLAVEIASFPDAGQPRLVARLQLHERQPTGGDSQRRLVAARVTNRRLDQRVPLPAGTLTALGAACDAGSQVRFLSDPEPLHELAEILARGDRVRFLSSVMHRELMAEIRWSAEDVRQSRDGVDVATLELTPTDLAGMRLISNWKIMQAMRNIGAGRGLEKPTRKAVAAASAVGLLSHVEATPQGFVTGGRAMQRIWLAATARGVAFQPMTALLYLFARLERGGGEGLSPRLGDEIAELRDRFRKLFVPNGHRAELMLFRLAVADPPSARALRRPVSAILSGAG